MKNIFYICIFFLVSGCATSPVYNPVTSATQQTFLLNGSSLAQIKMGMTQAQVHQIMGDSIVIGYAYQKPLTDESSVEQAKASDYKPLTIANPYKTEDIKGKEGIYTIEYYVNSIKQFDGVLTDDELIPLIFHEGILIARGWDEVKVLRSQNPS
jgi:hypothetical protein